MEIKEDNIYDDIKSAMAETEESGPDTTIADEPLSEATSTRERDATGKFKAKTVDIEAGTGGVAEPDAAPEATQVLGQVQLTTEKAPSSWTPKAREEWANLPEHVKADVIRREQDAANRAITLQQQYEPMTQMFKVLNPYAEEARALGVDLGQHIGSTLNSERILRTADVPAKFNEILRICDQYNIPLRQIVNQSVGQNVLQQPQQHAIPPQIESEIQAMRDWRERFELNEAQGEINKLGEQEFFEDVRDIMADMIEKEGWDPSDLGKVYAEATWRHPGVREVLVSRSGKSAGSNALAGRQASAAGASVRSSGKVSVHVDDDDSDDIHSLVTKSFNSASTGRV